jgi:hypothetical protein
MATLQQIIDRASQMAQTISGGNVRVNESGAELFVPQVLKYLLRKGNLPQSQLYSLRQTFEVDFVDNEAVTPPLAMPEYFESATLNDSTNSLLVSFVPTVYDFNLPLPSQFGYWTIQDDTIRVKLIDNENYSGQLIFECVAEPDIPASPTEEIALTADLTDSVVAELARVILGQAPYMKLGDDKPNA